MLRWTLGQGILLLKQGDLTRERFRAVVNAANSALAGGGGVDGALHRAAGPELLKAGLDIVRENGPLPPGKAVITPGFGLPAEYVIHAVGPVWRSGRAGEAETLASCYAESLRLAHEHGIETIAFPAVSCGVYGYPVDRAALVAVRALRAGLEKGLVREAAMILHGREAFDAWAAAAENELGPPENSDT